MPNNKPHSSFTTASKGGILNRLTNEVIIQNEAKQEKVIALWDTGATGTCIAENLVKELGLTPTGMLCIHTPSGEKDVHTYMVDIVLPNRVIITDVMVMESEIGKQRLGVLIGMDIINRGDFAVSNYNGKTVFTFRMPSIKTTDYVKETSIENLIGPTHGKGKRKKK